MTLLPGDFAPWFKGRTPSNPEYIFDTVAGRYVLMLFMPADGQAALPALRALVSNQAMFDDVRVTAFVVTRSPDTAETARDVRGLRWFLDLDGEISRLYGALLPDGTEVPICLLLDPTLRVLSAGPLDATPAMLGRVGNLPAPAQHAGVEQHAPVLVVPRVIEPPMCQTLINAYETAGGSFSGVMRDDGDETRLVMDDLKKRRDLTITDEALRTSLRIRLERRLFGLMERAFSSTAPHVERYLVGCYSASDGGVFYAHRDNATHATAHRKFACSINLNSDFDGGDLRFPEFGDRTYRPPPGGAVVFSGALLHEVTRVTRGRRYAFLPFFYDDAGAKVRADYEARTAKPAA